MSQNAAKTLHTTHPSLADVPHPIKPCLVCGGVDVHLESMRPDGRLTDVWRAVCSCGETGKQWAVSPGAAIRAWNRNLACQDDHTDYKR